ncbi:MAG: T9SS type A sorting domain-containing protein [Saprospiraceae bacterium]|nr:T9SS type A sorting domain-containing protein [Saprospiraceae bacterium]
MKHLFLIFFSLLFQVSYAQSPVTGNPADLPFTLELEETTQDELPGFHSCAFAQWEGWWVIVGGRVGGLHGFFPITGFPENEANTAIWIIDPVTGSSHNFPIDVLTVPFPDQLKSTNPQFAQDGSRLFIAGGYGKQASSGNFITFPVLTAIQLPELVAALQTNTNPSTHIRQIEAPDMRVCGGEMEKMGDYFYLVGGHDFTGKYSDPNNGSFVQSYTNEIRKFKINSSPNSLSISDYTAIHDDQNLHRRDFTLAPTVTPGGANGLGLYGGVFRPNEALPYYHPVYISENQPIDLDEQYEQLFSQYTCPTVPIFDAFDQSMYTLFFGGLSVHYVDQSTQSIQFDERVPFIKDITTFHRAANGASKEYVMPIRFDALLGTNMIFAFSEAAPHYSNEVFKLREMTGRTFVGYLFGGIKAEIPNITPSSASDRMFKVFITPRVSSGAFNLASDDPTFHIYPNPFSSGDRLTIEGNADMKQLELYDTNGRRHASGNNVEEALQLLPSGVYYLKINGKAGKMVVKRD